MAVIFGNHIYVATKLNEANDPYKLLCNINKRIEIGYIYNGVTDVTQKFTRIFLFEILDMSGFELLTFDRKQNTIWFTTIKVTDI